MLVSPLYAIPIRCRHVYGAIRQRLAAAIAASAAGHALRRRYAALPPDFSRYAGLLPPLAAAADAAAAAYALPPARNAPAVAARCQHRFALIARARSAALCTQHAQARHAFMPPCHRCYAADSAAMPPRRRYDTPAPIRARCCFRRFTRAASCRCCYRCCCRHFEFRRA